MDPNAMQKTARKNGFTLVELMVALIVTGIIMSAVATLAYAFSSANDATDDMDRRQAEVRFATLRISELIRHCKLICVLADGNLVIWRDDNTPDGEGQINPEELVYIETGDDRIQLMDFHNSPSWFQALQIRLSWLQDSWLKTTLETYCDEECVVAVPECSNVQFRFDAAPPQSKFVNIAFELTQNGSVCEYHIDSALRSWAGHLLNEDADGLVENDDD